MASPRRVLAGEGVLSPSPSFAPGPPAAAAREGRGGKGRRGDVRACGLLATCRLAHVMRGGRRERSMVFAVVCVSEKSALLSARFFALARRPPLFNLFSLRRPALRHTRTPPYPMAFTSLRALPATRGAVTGLATRAPTPRPVRPVRAEGDSVRKRSRGREGVTRACPAAASARTGGQVSARRCAFSDA